MSKSITEYKNEIKSLEEKRQKIEIEITKVQTKKESFDKELKEQFGITFNEVDDKLTELNKEIGNITNSLDTKIETAKTYISQLEKILND